MAMEVVMVIWLGMWMENDNVFGEGQKLIVCNAMLDSGKTV